MLLQSGPPTLRLTFRKLRWFRGGQSSGIIYHIQACPTCWRSLAGEPSSSAALMHDLSYFIRLYGYVAVPLPGCIIPLTRISRTSHPLAYRQISTRTDYYKYSFYPLTDVQRNYLPASVATLADLDGFKRAVGQVYHSKH